MKTLRLFIVSAVLLSACAGPRMGEVPRDLAPLAKEQTAYLIGTLGVQTEGDERSPDGHYLLQFRAVGGKQSGTIMFQQTTAMHTPVAYRTPDSKGGIFVMALRPGRYEFHNVSFSYRMGVFETYVRGKRDFSLPFTLTAGRALYVGEFTARTVWNRNVAHSTVSGGFFTRSDKFERDKALLETAHPEIRGVPVDNLPPEIQAPPFIMVGK